ncbi:MAG: HEAT repeat domain-containing protein [Planctomycetota bacterium]
MLRRTSVRPRVAIATASLALGALGAGTLTPGCASAGPRVSRTPEAAIGPIERSQARERAIAALERYAGDPNPVVRGNALEGLLEAPGRASPVLRRALNDESPGVRAIALMAIGRAERASLLDDAEPLLRDPSPYVRLSAVYAMAANRAPRQMSTLADAVLEADDPRLRAHAAVILGELGNESALPLLRQAARRPMRLADPVQLQLMRLQMGEAMVKLGDEAQVHPLRAALYPARPEELEAAALAARILGEVRDRGSVDQLILLTAKEDETGRKLPPEVRLSAVYALAEIGQPQGFFIAEEYLAHPSPQVRALAALSLGRTGQARHLPVLEGMLADADPAVRVHAAAAVVRLTRP